MGFDDFVDLNASCDDSNRSEENDVHKLDSSSCEVNRPTSTSQPKEDILIKESMDNLECNGEVEEDQHVQDMDLEDDVIEKQTVLQGSFELVATVKAGEDLNKVQQEEENSDLRTVIVSTSSNLLIDESSISGVKRARVTSIDKSQPSVRVMYNSLTRESKRKLMELMQHWSEWHARQPSAIQVSGQEALECGEETYFPALHVGSDKSSSVSFWLDNQARKEDLKNNDSVPLYDREYSLHLASLDGSANPERIEKEDSRCFNCGSYSHSLKECTKPRDNVAINNARKQHKSKRNQSAGNRGQIRYYQKAPGKFDDLKAGVLGPETRECLGIGEYDPPPWFHRMRKIGYPPGYLDVVEDKDEPSGITIYADEEAKEDFEDGELPERDEPEPPERRMRVEFPGINAPIPENADHKRWASESTRSGPTSYRSRSHLHLPSSDSHMKRHHDQLRPEELHDECPPGAEQGHSSMPVYSPRYNPYDYNPHLRSPSIGRSISDSRGWRSPLPYDSTTPHSPHSPHSQYQPARQSPQHDSPYGASTDISSRHGRDRYDHRRHRHR